MNINYDNTEVFPSGVVDDTESIKDRMLGNVDGGRIGKAIRSAVSPTLQRGSKSGFRRTSAPIKANLDLWSYYAKNEFRRGNFTGAESFYQR